MQDAQNPYAQYQNVSTNDINMDGPVVHEQLPQTVIANSALICEVLKEFEGMNVRDFLDDLSREQDYDDELVVWNKIAGVYLWCTRQYNLPNLEQRKEVFALINTLSMYGDLPQNAQFQYLPPDIISAVCSAWLAQSANASGSAY